MNDDRIIALIWLVGALALVGRGMVGRRIGGDKLGGRGTIRLALLWAGIIGITWALAATIQRILF